MAAAQKMLSIFDYHDYRQFLADWLTLRREEAVSMTAWAKRLGVSASFISLLLKGQRKLSHPLATKICSSIGLNHEETAFFLKLVDLVSNTELQEQKKAFRNLKRTKIYRFRNENNHAMHRYITTWYFIAIREMSRLPGFSFDPSWIHERLNFDVPVSKIKEALDFLIKYKFIEFNSDGTPTSVQKEIRCDGVVLRLAQAEYHEQMLGLGVRSFFENNRSSRDLLGKTIALTEAQFETAKKLIHETFGKIQELTGDSEAQSTQAKKIFQLSSFAYALSEAVEPTRDAMARVETIKAGESERDHIAGEPLHEDDSNE